MTEEAKRQRREYMRKWRAENKEREKQYRESYWEKKAIAERTKADKSGHFDNE